MVDHVTVYRWVQRLLRCWLMQHVPAGMLPGIDWFVDEMFVKVAGRWVYLAELALAI